jgi:hypothetical protein
MFGLLDGFKYRSEVMVQIHAILKFVPELGQLLKTFPTVKLAINQLRKEKMPAAEAASSSLLVIERAVANIPRETRALTLQQLKDSADNEFRFFSEIAGALSEDKCLPRGNANSDDGSRFFALVFALSAARRANIAAGL